MVGIDPIPNIRLQTLLSWLRCCTVQQWKLCPRWLHDPMAIVGALRGPGYIGMWVFSFAGVGKLVKHTVNSQLF